MQIHTFTNFWNMEKKIYSIYDLQLPVPVPIKTVAVFGAISLPYWLILNIFSVPFELNGLMILVWVAPPLVAAFFSNKPIFQGKNIVDFTKSQINFILEAKNYKGLTPATEKYETSDYVEEKFYTFDVAKKQ